MKAESTLIKNVRILDPTLQVDEVADVAISGGSIEAIATGLKAKGEGSVVEAKGFWLLPGFIDLHTHLREPGFEHKETIETGTRSAAAGGFTTVCCMANTNPVNDSAAITQYILEKSRAGASTRVLPIGAISKGLQGRELAEIGELKEAGCVAVSDDGMTVMDTQLMRLAMDYAQGFGLPVVTHSVDAHLSRGGSMHEGEVSCRLGLKGIPAEAEDIVVARDIYLSRLTGCHLHVAHVSTAGGVELIRRAKREGLRVTGEAAPHHFTLTDQACENYNTHAKMCPPLRSEFHRQAVVAGLADGTLDCIATDHAPHATVDKETEFDDAAFGILGFETALPLSLRLVEQGQLSLERMIRALSSEPLKILKRPYAGIKAGAAADLVLIDPEQSWNYRAAEGFSKSRNSPFEGWEMKGKVIGTWVGGRRVHSC